MLELEAVTAGYGGVAVARDIDLRVRAGEIACLLGPNGAGKTTILLTIAGFLTPLAGRVSLDGTEISGRAPSALARDGLALIPDDRALIASLTVRETFGLVRRSRRDPFELFPELVKLRNRRCGLLSGGEQQMVGLARAFMTNPRVLIIDELSQGLAPVVLQRIFPTIKTAASELGSAVLIVEQEVDRALAVADRAYVINHGRLVIADRPARELQEDRSTLTAAYLG